MPDNPFILKKNPGGRKRALTLFRSFFVWTLCLWLLPQLAAAAPTRFRLLSYNVENLFDLNRDGTEYVGFIPYTGYGWNSTTAAVKYANIASVIAEINPHVAVLSEVESRESIAMLQRRLEEVGCDLSQAAIAERETVVRCAVLSSFPILESRDVKTGPKRRAILRVTLDVYGKKLVIYANHWKSKDGPESQRMGYAKALARDIKTLPPGTDYILAGDFNADHNEWLTFKEDKRLNDTSGKTGINHVLKNMTQDAMVSQDGVTRGEGLHYDLWMELPPHQRWSYNFFGKKGSLDHILLPKTLFDEVGISYVDNSFKRFTPDWLFHKKTIYRWQRAKRGRGKHLGRGYSDHLPIYADFQTSPFVADLLNQKVEKLTIRPPLSNVSVADLYKMPAGAANGRITGAIVVYKAGSSAVIKEPGGRGIYVYKAAEGMKPGDRVDLTVRQLGIYTGLREITAVSDLKVTGRAQIDAHLLKVTPDTNLRDTRYTSEVIGEICGLYRGGWLSYAGGRSVRLYMIKGIKRPRNDTEICLRGVRMGFYKGPQLTVDETGQWEKKEE